MLVDFGRQKLVMLTIFDLLFNVDMLKGNGYLFCVGYVLVDVVWMRFGHPLDTFDGF